MESEMQLDEELARFESVAAQPELLPLLSSKWFQSSLPLLQHQNSDIAGRVVSLLVEMTEMDEDILPVEYDHLFDFCEALISNQVLPLLLENILRLDESKQDEAETVFKTVSIIENFIDIDPGVLQPVPEEAWKSWADWLAARFYQQLGSEANRFYAAEIVAILLRACPNFQSAFLSSSEGVDKTLASIAWFKVNGNPSSADEIEYFENLFDIFCDLVMDVRGLPLFMATEGIAFILMLLKETKLLVRVRATRVLSFALADRQAVAMIASDVVSLGGLKVLSPILMRKGIAALKKQFPKIYSDAQDVEYVCSIFASLLRFSTLDVLQRIEAKYEENDGEKIGSLISLHNEYHEKDGDDCLAAIRQVDLILAILKSRKLIGLSQAKPVAAIKDQIASTLTAWAQSLAGLAPEECEYLITLCRDL
jgi:beta-catenin-like protein 1